ncbi:death domain-associated protein 6 [Takifugu rubripes]|uniref:death domain-associated protein 6 n=1 Tax=Takifugu rubripes TaxID=31033 RepID=UPI001145DF9C|nr:death domain-associated protein 6 [Takifugu rubripes]XP_011607435.2 death domain-associated protein 6 [Takifugu rubripes]
MAVAPASLADKIIVLDGDDEDESLKGTCSVSTSSNQPQAAAEVFQPDVQHPVPSHITHSPFASNKKEAHVLQAENQRLFAEFVAHCSADTMDCPEVLAYLETRHSKASPEYLSSVEFRNTLGHCLTRAQAHRSKTFVYINELCTVLKQHAAKKRQVVTKVETDPCTAAAVAFQSTSPLPKSNDAGLKGEGDTMNVTADNTLLSPSGLQKNSEDVNEEQKMDKRTKKTSRKQIAYLENLLKMYNDEIHRLQKSELSLDDLDLEDSSFVQENKLKRKLMKIYEKLCELKGCSTLTGRVIEHRIAYSSTRYPEINKRIERFINSPEAQKNPPDYQDILQQMLRTNERYNLCLSRKQLNQMAKEAFREVGTRIQDRRHLDLVYNFGSHITDTYKPASDPALSDSSLLRKLRSNREVSVSRLEEVISKYANKQEDTEELERKRRQEKKEKGDSKSEKEGKKEVNGVEEQQKDEEEDEEEDDEEDNSSDPDIEEEIQASAQQDGPDEDNEDEDDNSSSQLCNGASNNGHTGEAFGNVSAGDDESLPDDQEPVTSAVSPFSSESKSQKSPLSDVPSPGCSPGHPESMQTSKPPSNCPVVESEELVESPCAGPEITPVAENGAALPLSPEVVVDKCCGRSCNGTSPPPLSPRVSSSHKRKRQHAAPDSPQTADDSEVEIPLDMGVSCSGSPQQVESIQANAASPQLTPPPKRNKVNVATQCDPEEVIVLSDSE